MNFANSTSLKSFLLNLADVFDGDIEIEKTARRELRKISQANFSTKQCALPAPILSVMQQSDAHPLCGDIVEMQIGDTFLDEAQGSCSVYKHGNNGGATLSVIAYDQNLVVWGSVQRAGGGKYYKHSGSKQNTKKFLENWPYIKDNWTGIRAASPRTTYVGDDLKVVLYEIDLRKEKNCIGFSKGYGNTEGSQGGQPGATDVMSVLRSLYNQ